jgi:hypothetical protein
MMGKKTKCKRGSKRSKVLLKERKSDDGKGHGDVKENGFGTR